MNLSIPNVLFLQYLRRSALAIALLLTVGSVIVSAQELPSESSTKIAVADGADLFRVRKLVAASQWDDAVDSLIDILQRAELDDENGERTFVSIETADVEERGYQLNLPLRAACHIELGRWHQTAPIALEAYRQRVDADARQLLQRSVAEQDTHLMQTIVDRWFASRVGDDALLMLGDYHLEAGHFAQARQCWEMLLPAIPSENRPADVEDKNPELQPPNSITTRLVYPDSDIPRAEIKFRLVLATILEGRQERVEAKVEAFAKQYPDVRGTVGGRDVALAAELRRLMDAEKSTASSSANTSSTSWSTFAGSSSRNSHAHGDPDPSGRPIWAVDIQLQNAISDMAGLGKPRVAETKYGILSYHPVIVGDTVLWHDSKLVRAVDIRSGKPKWPFDESVDKDSETKGRIWQPALSDQYRSIFRPRLGTVRFTSTVEGNLFFARMGNPLTGIQDDEPRNTSFVLALDLSKEGRMLPGFRLDPPARRFQFEASPIVLGSHFYIALRETAAQSSRVTMHVACYEIPALRSAKTCRQLWRTEICTADSPAGGRMDEATHVMLTRSEGTIYCNTNLGSIAAMNAESGQIQWIANYSREDFQSAGEHEATTHLFRELTPAVFDRGVLYVAPSDSHEIFAIDAQSGILNWKTEAANISQILGATEQHLIVSGNKIHWLKLDDGTEAAGFPTPGMYTFPGSPQELPMGDGRGIITTDAIYWPTREKIFLFDHNLAETVTATGARALFPRHRCEIDMVMRGVSGGNLLISGDYLIVATEDRIVAFNSTGRVSKSE